MKYSLNIPSLLEEISSLSHSVVFLYFFALIAEERREVKGKEERERYTHTQQNTKTQRIVRRDKKVILNEQCKAIEENSRMERLDISSRKLEISREHFMQEWAQ